MRAVLVVLSLSVLACSTPPAVAPPVVGHVRMRDRVIDLTVDQFDTRTATELHELRHATARHQAEVWADVNARELRFDRD
jgi:hypothetical protein